MSEKKIIVGMREAVDNARLREENTRLTAEVARLRDLLRTTLGIAEYWYERGNPEWDGSAADTSAFGNARAALEAADDPV